MLSLFMAEGPEANVEQPQASDSAPAERRANRLEWGAGMLLLMALVALFTCSTDLQAVRTARAFPNMLLDDPARALFVLAEYERAKQQAGVLSAFQSCSSTVAVGCSRQALERAWDDLTEDRRRFEAEGYLLAPGTQTMSIEHARILSLAGWGDVAALEQLRKIDDSELSPQLHARADELRRGDAGRDCEAGRRAALWDLGVTCGVSLISLAGVVAFIYWLRSGRPALARADGLPLPRLPLERALTVFLWAHAARAAMIRLYWSGAPGVGDWLRLVPASFLAAVVLLLWWATRPRRPVSAQGSDPKHDRRDPARVLLYWPKSAGQWAAVLLPVACVFALDFGASLALDVGGYALGHRSAWGETVDELMMFGSLPVALTSAVDLIVGAPIAEELLFRGILFTTLLRWTSLHGAALASASVFAAWHGYGVIGTVSVGVSGYLLALLYARRRSLLPPILLHALLNLVFSSYMFAYRG
jgi:membrane protease YdiL (CAAX protease family)